MTRSSLTLLLASSLLILPACRSARPLAATTAPAYPLPSDGPPGDGEERRNSTREEWFLRQRLYPLDSLQEDVRSKAFLEMQGMAARAKGAGATAETEAWVSLGPAPTVPRYESWGRTSGRIRSVAISPASSSIVLIGSSSGGIWRSVDGGGTFAPVSDDEADLTPASIVFAPSDPTIVYAAMGGEFLGTGVLKSIDAGATWFRVDQAGLAPMGQAVRIAVHPTNPELLLLAQIRRLEQSGEIATSGVYQSFDGGRTWQMRLAGFPTDLLFDPTDASIVYAALPNTYLDGKSAAVYRSLDSGASWEAVLVSPFEPRYTSTFRLTASAAKPGRIYAYSSGPTTGYYLHLSDDFGSTWFEQPASGLRNGRHLIFEASPGDAETLYYGTFVDLFRSTDGGKNWVNLTRNRNEQGYYQPTLSKTHPDQFSIAFMDGGEFLLGNDGGLYRSENGGESFQHLNATLSLTQIYGLSAHPRHPGLLAIGTQDNGLQVRHHDGGEWVEFQSGDYGRPWIDPLQDDRICAAFFASINCFTDFGRTQEIPLGNAYIFEVDEDYRFASIPPLVGNPFDRTLYFGTSRLWKATDLSGTWTRPGGDLDLTHGGYDVLTAIAPAPSNGAVIYTGSAEGRVMQSVDGGVTWTDRSSGLPDRYVTSIAVHPFDPNRIWITFSGFRTSHVFGSGDGGASWLDLQANLPDIPANALWIDPRRNGMDILLGTDIGVFRTVDGGNSWMPFNEGLPPVIVTDFAFGDGRVYAGTYGRGVFAWTPGPDPRRRPVRR